MPIDADLLGSATRRGDPGPVERWRSACGQAASEYVALVALVAVALALAAGLTSGGVGGQVLAGLQRGLCRVALADCPRPQPPHADLVPCPVERQIRTEELTGTLGVLRLGRSGTLTAVRRSDGSVTVTLAHGNTASADTGLGARLRLGRRTVGGGPAVTAGIGWNSGRSWTLPGEAAARRFIAAYGRKATLGGQLIDRMRSGCSVLCDAIGWNPHAELPEPDEIFAERGPVATLTASFGADVELSADAKALLGRRLRRDGGTTWYLKLSATATAALRLPAELAAGLSGDAVLSYELDADGRPHQLRLALAGELRGRTALARTLGSTRASLAAGEGVVMELDATLDLREPAYRIAAAELLEALTDRRRLPRLPQRAYALGRRIVEGAQLDRRFLAAARTATGLGAGIARGIKLDGDFERTTNDLRLLGAETRLPGLPFLPRDDCRTGAAG